MNKPACLDVFDDTCIDHRPDGITCFSYTHCLAVRSGIPNYNHVERIQKTDITLPQVGTNISFIVPIALTIILLAIRYAIKRT